MIEIKCVGRFDKSERLSDRKRKRLILTVGNHEFHVTRVEARKLRNQLQRLKLD